MVFVVAGAATGALDTIGASCASLDAIGVVSDVWSDEDMPSSWLALSLSR